MGATPKGQPRQFPLKGESIEDFYARRIEALMQIYNGAQQDFTRVDYRPFFSFFQPSPPEDQGLRPQWFARAPQRFNRQARHAMAHLLPIVSGILERAPLKARDRHAALMAREARDAHTDADSYLDEMYLNAPPVDNDLHQKAEQILQVAREQLGAKGVHALNLIRLGKTQPQIASELKVTDRTVRNWLEKIRRVLS